MAPVRTAAVLLRAHDYGDSSRILRFYTRGHGLLSVVAHGVRGRTGKGSATFASFASGELTAYVKAHRELHTLADFSCRGLRTGLVRSVLRFAGASAVAELVLAHAEQEAHPALFTTLETALDRLDSVDEPLVPAAVLAGLWTVTEALGFAPQLEACVRCGAALAPDDVGRFDSSAGGVRCPECGEGCAGPRIGPRARAQLQGFVRGELPSGLAHARPHLALLSDFAEHHVVHRPLKSLRFLAGLLPEDAVP
jgi:DNA repair protein RecO (recombination protein O)